MTFVDVGVLDFTAKYTATYHTKLLQKQLRHYLSKQYFKLTKNFKKLSATIKLSQQCAVFVGAEVQLVEYQTRNREVAGSTHTRSTASNLEQVAILLCAQANSASYPLRDGK